MEELDPTRLGLSGTLAALKQIIIDSFDPGLSQEHIADSAKLFQEGLDLNSLQGVELLVQVEDRFGVTVGDLDWSMHQVQTLSDLAGRILVWAGRGEAETAP